MPTPSDPNPTYSSQILPTIRPTGFSERSICAEDCSIFQSPEFNNVLLVAGRFLLEREIDEDYFHLAIRFAKLHAVQKRAGISWQKMKTYIPPLKLLRVGRNRSVLLKVGQMLLRNNFDIDSISTIGFIPSHLRLMARWKPHVIDEILKIEKAGNKRPPSSLKFSQLERLGKRIIKELALRNGNTSHATK